MGAGDVAKKAEGKPRLMESPEMRAPATEVVKVNTAATFVFAARQSAAAIEIETLDSLSPTAGLGK